MATRVYRYETVCTSTLEQLRTNESIGTSDTHIRRCAGVYTIVADFFPSKRRACDPYMVTMRRLAYALQRVTHPTCSTVSTRNISMGVWYTTPVTHVSTFLPGSFVQVGWVQARPTQLRKLGRHRRRLAEAVGNAADASW
ncbi:hypothetical protein ANTPLA_LOCUS11143 [Anthophora plagiata]